MTALIDFFHDLQKQTRSPLHTDEYSRILYSTDASIYQVMPHGVFIPKTVAEVETAVSLARRYHIPILPRTAGTSLAGQAVNEALIIDFSRHLDQIVELNSEEQWVRVQPGVVLDDLNTFLKPHGLLFGPDPASSNRACLGGIVSNNATGSHSIVYGMTADHVLEMQVVLSDGSTAYFTPDGIQPSGSFEGHIHQQIGQLIHNPANQTTIRAGTPRHWRRCGGYNLDRLLDNLPNLATLVCGAEGTLAVITEMKLNLVPRPNMTALAVIQFDSLQTALSAVPAILQTNPSAVELLENLGLTMCRQVPEYARLLATFIEGQPFCLLITEYTGESEVELQHKLAGLRRHLQQEKVGETAVLPALSPALQANVWAVRKVALGLMSSIKSDFKPTPFIEDAAVPVEHLAAYVTQIEQFCNDLGTQVAYYAHASAGCLHIRPLLNLKLASEVAKLPHIAQFSLELLQGYGGALSSEHGDGRTRSWLNRQFFGPDLYSLYQQVKHIFDPHNLLNPGNIVEPVNSEQYSVISGEPPITQNLRYGPAYQVIPLTTHLDFSQEQGMDRAVEMCNGAGVCRKMGGTMCPSFMVTKDETHSTRGRANALRAVLSGRLPATELTSPRLHGVMDLCIECKACKAECPSAVDMAKLKFEFLAQYQQKHGVSLRTWLFAHIETLNQLGSGRLAPLTNWLLQNGVVKAGLERFVGISRRRALPPLARQPFTGWFKNHPVLPTNDAPQVVLLVDPFNNYHSPQVLVAAVEVLEAAGFRVTVPKGVPDGRSFISKGLVQQAKTAVSRTVQTLAPYARQGVPIIGVEPSSLLTLRDESLYLLPNQPEATLVAQHAYTFEEFMAKTAETNPLSFTTTPRHLLLHGHCHQKALVGTAASKKVLSLPPNYVVTEVDSGCCGMAGSFGYEVEHVELSLKMGERRLFPAVRQADAQTLVVVAGFSCRQQLKHATDRIALHPAEVLRQALV